MNRPCKLADAKIAQRGLWPAMAQGTTAGQPSPNPVGLVRRQVCSAYSPEPFGTHEINILPACPAHK